MIKSNEILTLFAILKKANQSEIMSISRCCMDEFILKHASENPIPEIVLKDEYRKK
jgi:hypothetical protein